MHTSYILVGGYPMHDKNTFYRLGVSRNPLYHTGRIMVVSLSQEVGRRWDSFERWEPALLESSKLQPPSLLTEAEEYSWCHPMVIVSEDSMRTIGYTLNLYSCHPVSYCGTVVRTTDAHIVISCSIPFTKSLSEKLLDIFHAWRFSSARQFLKIPHWRELSLLCHEKNYEI